MLCPKCHAPIDLTTGVCRNQHQYPFENGVLCLLDDALRERLATIYQHRTGVTAQLPVIDDYNALPYVLADQHFEWRLRAYDADVVLKYMRKNQPQRRKERKDNLEPQRHIHPSPYNREGAKGRR